MNLRAISALSCLLLVSHGLDAAPASLLGLARGEFREVRLQPQSASERGVTMQAVNLRAPRAVTEVISGGVHTRLVNDQAEYFLGVDARVPAGVCSIATASGVRRVGRTGN